MSSTAEPLMSKLGNRCIFTIVRFQSLYWNVKKISVCMKWETSYHMESVWTIFIHWLRCNKIFYTSLRSLVRFFLTHRNSWIKIVCVHFPWNNLHLRHEPCRRRNLFLRSFYKLLLTRYMLLENGVTVDNQRQIKSLADEKKKKEKALTILSMRK